jgi:flagellar motor component MotA
MQYLKVIFIAPIWILGYNFSIECKGGQFMYYIGILVFLAVVSFITAMSGFNVSILLNFSSLLLVVGGILTFIISVGKFKAFLLCFKKQSEINDDKREELKTLLVNASKISIVTGIMGFIMGLIFSLAGFNDDIVNLVKNISVSITSVIYGLFFAFFVFLPLRLRLENKR